MSQIPSANPKLTTMNLSEPLYPPSKPPHPSPNPKRPYQNPPYALNSDLDSLKYHIYPEEAFLNEDNKGYSYEKDSIPYENSALDLETVPERSIESELTYKTSILDLPTNKNSFKGDSEDFFPNSTRKSEQQVFRPYEIPYLLSNHTHTPRSPLEDKIKIVDNLKPEELHWKLRALSIENETFRAENTKFKEECLRLKGQYDRKVGLLEKENLKIRKLVEEKEEEVFYRRQEARKLNEEIKALKLEREGFYKEKEKLLEEKQTILRKSKENERNLQLQIEEIMLLQEKHLEEKLNELVLEKQYQYHTKEKRLRSENESLRYTNDSLIQKIDLLSNRKPSNPNSYTNNTNNNKNNANNNKNNTNDNNLLDFILSELDIKASSLEELHHQISEFKSQHKQVLRFAELVLEMTANCHPKETFPLNKPSLKQAWKWLKSVLENYMILKKSTMKEGLQVALANEENEDLVLKIMENLGVKRKGDLLTRFYDCLNENYVFNRMLPKIKRLLKLEKRSSVKEIERKLEELV